MNKPIAAALLLLLLALTACSNLAGPNPAVLPTTTVFPKTALLPASKTPDVVASLVPEGQPAPEWNGIPIMPGAIAGDGDEESYVFAIRAMPQQVQEYYQRELSKLGWQPFAIETKDSSRMLMFTNEASATLTISILTKGDQTLVLLAK